MLGNNADTGVNMSDDQTISTKSISFFVFVFCLIYFIISDGEGHSSS